MPAFFFVEGAQNGNALKESSIHLVYASLGVFGQDDINLTVTPVVEAFDFKRGDVKLKTEFGVTQALIAGPGNDPTRADWAPTGMHVRSRLIRSGIPAGTEPLYIQNVGYPGQTGIVNGHGAAVPKGIMFEPGRGLVDADLTVVDGAGMPMAAPIIVLDKQGDALPPPPDYAAQIDEQNAGPGRVLIDAYDSPSVGNNIAGAMESARELAVRLNFRIWLLWRFAPENDGQSAIYTVAQRDWTVFFRGDTRVAGQGLSRVNPASEIRSDGWTRSHEVPARLDGPTYNRNNGWV